MTREGFDAGSSLTRRSVTMKVKGSPEGRGSACAVCALMGEGRPALPRQRPPPGVPALCPGAAARALPKIDCQRLPLRSSL